MLSTDYKKIPVLIIQGLSRYAEQHQPVGSFLQAVLTNNLREAFARADAPNRAALWEIVGYCHWELPSDCWGSEERVRSWLQDWAPPHSDLDTIDLEHDQGLRDLTDPWDR